jgi:hypothetical protein
MLRTLILPFITRAQDVIASLPCSGVRAYESIGLAVNSRVRPSRPSLHWWRGVEMEMEEVLAELLWKLSEA